MSRLLAMMTNDDSLSAVALEQVRATLSTWAPEPGEGLGLGWLHEQRTLLRKYPATSAPEVELTSALQGLSSRAVMACVGQGSEGSGHDPERIGPFRDPLWLYAQRGQALEPWALMAQAAQLPDFLRRQGASDPEPAQLTMLSLLHSLHAHDVYHQPPHVSATHSERRAQAAARMMRRLQEQAGGQPAAWAFVAMTGRMWMAGQTDACLFWRAWRGLEEPAPAPLYAGQRVRATHHAHFKALMVVAADQAPGPQWSALPAGHVMWSHDWEVRSLALDEVSP